MTIDPRLIDVTTPPNGYLCGCLPRQDRCGDRAPIYENELPLIPEWQWEAYAVELDRAEALIPYTLNQGKEGSCVGNASSWGFDFVQAITRGTDRVIPTSAMSLFARIGSSAQSGAMIGDALAALRAEGILPLDTPENRARFAHVYRATGYGRGRKDLPTGWEETAAQFRVQEYWDIDTIDGLVSALLLGYCVIYGRSGHCICGVRPVRENGVWYLKYKNSWGDWGDNGYGYDTLTNLARQRAYGWYAMRTVTHLSLTA